MSLRQAAQQALEALDEAANVLTSSMFADAATALRTALSEPEQEPVAICRTWHEGRVQHAELWDWTDGLDALPDGEHRLYAHPAPQPVELTDDDLEDIAIAARKGNLTDLRNAIERAHGIGGEE